MANNIRFAIFGKIIHTDYFVNKLHENGFPKPLVIVSLDEEYHRDKELLTPYGLYSQIDKLSQDGLCDVYKMETVNSVEALELFDKYESNIAISINCRNIIKKNIIDYFDENIFNLHDSFLPNERGGALNSWRILNGVNEVGNTIHYLEEGIDTGAVVVQRKSKIIKDRPESLDYLKAEKDICEVIISEFISLVKSGNKLTGIKQKNDNSYYFPRLFTEINGAIDWSWSAEEIERFVRAFSLPYPGAFTYFADKQIRILKCVVDEDGHKFHPFSSGKIVTIMDNKNVRVIAGGMSLIIQKISVDNEVVLPGDFLSVKYTLYTPAEELIKSRLHVPTTLSMNKKEKSYNESV